MKSLNGSWGMEQVAFGPFSVDMAGRRLRKGSAELELRPQAFRALSVLVRNRGQYVNHEQMIREAWDGLFVSHNTVAVTVAQIKKVLQEYGSWIRCRPKVGYRLDVPGGEDLIRKGWHLWERRTREGLEKALACFQQAALEDGADHRAFEGISICYLILCTYSMRPAGEMYPKFLEAHERAVQLRGLTPALRSNRGHALHICERNFDRAESDLLQSLHDDPTLATTYIRLALLYSSMERLDTALDMILRCRTADPLCPVLLTTETFVRLCRREFDQAVICGKSSIDLHPYQYVGRVHYAEALERTGRIEQALAELRLVCVMSPDLPWLRALEATCVAKRGQQVEALTVLDELQHLRKREYVDAYYMALLLDALGRRNDAFAELERARLEKSATLFQLNVDPRSDALRLDTRFEELRQRVFGGSVESIDYHQRV